MSFFRKSIRGVLVGIQSYLAIFMVQEADAKTFFKPIQQLQPKIPGDSILGDGFGQSVWINKDYAFVAAPFTSVNGAIDAGAIYVYKRTGKSSSHWVNTQIITTGGSEDTIGFLSVQSQGNWLLFSATGTPIQGLPKDDTGSVLAYHLNEKNGQWEFVQSLDRTNRFLTNLTPQGPSVFPPSDTEDGAEFGFSLSLDVKKGVLLVGAPGQEFFTAQSNPVVNAGQVFVFKLQQKTKRWVLTQRISNPDGATANNHFGEMLCMDGDLALISATTIIPDLFNLAGSENGSVYLYQRNNAGNWKFVQKVVGSQVGRTIAASSLGPLPLGDSFGSTLAMDHDWAIIGAPFESQNSTALLRGAAYFYSIKRGDEPSIQFYQKIFSDDPTARYKTLKNLIANKNAFAIRFLTMFKGIL